MAKGPEREPAPAAVAEPAESEKERRRPRPSIAATLTLGFGLLMVIAVGAVLWVTLEAGRRNTLDLLRQTAELGVDSITARIEQHLGAAARQAEYLAERLAEGRVEPEDPERLMELMLGALAATPQVSGIAFIRADLESFRVGRRDGRMIRLSSDWSTRPEIVALTETVRERARTTWSGVIWVADLSAPHVEVAVPAFRRGFYLGTFVSVVSIRALSAFLGDLEDEVSGRSFILYGRDRVLAHPSLRDGTQGRSIDQPLPGLDEVGDAVLAEIWAPEPLPLEILAESAVRGHAVEGAGDQQIYIYRELGGYGSEPWFIGMHFLGGDVDTEIRRLETALIVAAAILTAALAAAFLLGRAISRPIAQLAEGSRAIRNLDLAEARPLGRQAFREIDNAAAAHDAMLSGLRWFETYVPKRLVLRLMRLGAIAPEQRQVTVMFTDIVAFSALSETVAPPELLQLLNRHFTLLLERIEDERGTVDKYIGDSVMAFWGAPEDQPDHAAAACRAALAIRSAIAAENDARRARGQGPLRLRIGLHSGTAVVGNIGAPGRVNYTMIGDTVNVAQRLEELGKAIAAGDADATILLSGETAAGLQAAFRLQPLGAQQLRGRRGPTEVYALLGVTAPVP